MRFSLYAFLALSLFFVSGCDLARNQLKPDREAGMELQDYRDALAPRLPEVAEEVKEFAKPSIPKLQPYVAAMPSNLKPMPLVSVTVNQSVPLRDVLFEIARQTDYDLELDPRIEGAIIFSARERPLDQVVERIAEIAGLRYRFKDDVMRIELDTPFSKTYRIDYLSYIRTSESSVRNDIAVVSGEGADTGSSFKAESESSADFWGELEQNLQQILRNTTSAMVSANTPQLSIPSAGSGISTSVGRETGSAVQQLPSFSVNKQAGLISVFANDKAHEGVADYLNLLRRSVTAQVLIEAKILEVTLTDEFAAGIDWQTLDIVSGKGILGFGSQAFNISATSFATSSAPTRPSTSVDGNNFMVGYLGNDIEAVVQALAEFGGIRALASPRMTVLNNQPAVLNVANNRVFFEIDIDTTVDEGTTQTDIDSDIRNVPEGVLVNVQPSIDLDRGVISLAVRPTVTRIVNTIPDPAIQFVTAQGGISGVESLVPELNVQEIDTVIQVRSGQPVVMGGLLQDTSNFTERAVPVLGEMPLVGGLFRSQDDEITKTELVILLKATILETPGDTIHNTDRDLFKTFGKDRRPFKL